MRAFVVAVALVVALALPASARTGLNVLIGTEVSQPAQATMSPALWTRLVERWVGERPIPFKGKPSLEDCARAKALYMVYAPFELKPKLPGGTMLHVNDRIAALAHVTAVNCVTKQTVYDQVIGLSSNPVSTSNEGDLEPIAAVTWESAIVQTLHAHPIVFENITRVSRVSPPFVFIEGGTKGLAVGQTVRIYAGADGTVREPPVILTIISIVGRQIEAQYDSTDPHNKVRVGDLVEPYAAIAPAK